MRIRLSWILQPGSNIIARALFSAISTGISLGVMATAAVLTHSRFVFPSLGPTAFLFFTTPTAPSASPRNTVLGHGIGVCAGYFSLVVTGLTLAGPALIFGVTWRHVIAAGLSLALTAGFMVLLGVPHPPAGATTLLISLGIMSNPSQLGVLMLAVGVLTLQAIIINRFLGIPFPLWRPLPTPEVASQKDIIDEQAEKTTNLNSSKRSRKRVSHKRRGKKSRH
jgi:CBS-domain-containing membrane protein